MTYFISYEFHRYFFNIVLGLICFIPAIYFLKTTSRARYLKRACTETVDARCIRCAHDGAFRNRKYNCTYSFEYEGRTWTANNGIWFGIFTLYLPREGSKVKLRIDPSDPSSEIYDGVARNAVVGGRCISLFTGLLGVFTALMPFLDKYGLLSF